MSAPGPNEDERKLYLDHINVTGIRKWKFRVKLRLQDGNGDKNIDLEEHAHRWIPSNSCEVPATGSISIILKAGVAVGGFGLGKQEKTIEISGRRISEEFIKSSSQRNFKGSSNAPNSHFSISENVTFDDHSTTLVLTFHPSQTSETAHQALDRVKVVMEEYSQLKPNKVMRSVDTALKLGLAASEVVPYTKAAFSIARATYDLLSQQQKYDEQVSDLVSRIEKILGFFKKVEEISYDHTGLFIKAMEQMNELVVKTADFACIYVQRSFRIARSAISPTDRKSVDELKIQLDNLIGEFNRAIEVETLKTTKDIDTKLLLKRLKPVDAGYNCMRKCMEGTRQRLINKIVTWAVEPVGATPLRKQSATESVLWLYGMPGIGKTSVANSICARLHTEKKLGGSFFCRRDDPKLGNPQYVLPTLACRLAEMWGPFRKLVAEELSEDPQITPESTGGELLTRLLKSLQNHPPHPLVLVIDALDECGDNRAREIILRRIFDATSCVLWLKVIITSRQEGDINEFFEQSDRHGRYLLEDLSMDDKAHEDIQHFTQKRLASIEAAKYLKDWAPEHLVNKIVMRASGLYIFVETLWRLVKNEPDPEKHLNLALEGSSGDALGDLYALYSSILSSRAGRDNVEFKAIMGAILVVGSYRPLCAQTIAILVGRPASVVETLVGNMSSLLYRDNRQNGGIRFRHLSIINFLTSASCPEDFRVDIRQIHQGMALACLSTMKRSLKFNICKLRSSLLSNEEVKDLEERIRENIQDELQYSCMHWSSHLSLSPYYARSDIMGTLDEFFDDVRPLYWVEVLSLMGKAPIGTGMLRDVLRWAKGIKSPAIEYMDDVLRFLSAFIVPITTSAPHMYVSALPFTPTGSTLWKKASRSFQNLLRVERGRTERWPARPSTWTGHTSPINSLAYSPDGMYVVSGSVDGTIRIWDTETGAPVGEPRQGDTGGVRSVAYSPDNQRIISISDSGTIQIWNGENGAPVGEPLKSHTQGVASVAYSPDGRHIASGSYEGTIRIWDAEMGVPVGEPMKGHTGSVDSISYSPDGRHLISISQDKTIRIWDVNPVVAFGGLSTGPTAEVSIVTSSPDSQHVVSGSSMDTIRISDMQKVQSVRVLASGPARCVAFSPDGRHVVSGCESGTIQFWDAETGAPVGDPLKGHTGMINGITYSPNGQHVVSGSYDSTIQIWDAETRAPVNEPLKGHTECVLCVAYSPDGSRIISGSWDNTIRMWNAESGAPVGEEPRVHVHSIESLAYSPDGRHLVSGSRDTTIRIWDMDTGAPINESLKGHTDVIKGVAYSPDGLHVVSGSRDDTIRIWNAETGVPVGEPLTVGAEGVTSVAYSPDGRNIVSGSYDGTARIWVTEGGTPVSEPLKGHTSWVRSVAYSPNGQHVSGSCDDTIWTWDVETGEPVGEPLKGHTDPICRIAYSPDGRHLASGSRDHTIRIWDVDTGAPVGEPLKGHTDCLNDIAYSPDGRYIVSVSDGTEIRIWDAGTGAPIGEPFKWHEGGGCSVAYSPDGRHIASGSSDKIIRIWDVTTGTPTVDNRIQVLNTETPGDSFTLDLRPDKSGWVRHPNGGLLVWIPEQCRNGLTCAAILTIPTDGFDRAVRLDLGDACLGASWEQIKAL